VAASGSGAPDEPAAADREREREPSRAVAEPLATTGAVAGGRGGPAGDPESGARGARGRDRGETGLEDLRRRAGLCGGVGRHPRGAPAAGSPLARGAGGGVAGPEERALEERRVAGRPGGGAAPGRRNQSRSQPGTAAAASEERALEERRAAGAGLSGRAADAPPSGGARLELLRAPPAASREAGAGVRERGLDGLRGAAAAAGLFEREGLEARRGGGVAGDGAALLLALARSMSHFARAAAIVATAFLSSLALRAAVSLATSFGIRAPIVTANFAYSSLSSFFSALLSLFQFLVSFRGPPFILPSALFVWLCKSLAA
jgi:hypothetical protein